MAFWPGVLAEISEVPLEKPRISAYSRRLLKEKIVLGIETILPFEEELALGSVREREVLGNPATCGSSGPYEFFSTGVR